MNTFYMLVGLPGSGKSWQAQRIKEDHLNSSGVNSVVWISSDAIREEMYGSEDIQGDSSVVFAEMKRRTDTALKAGYDVIYDACNINSKRRKGFLDSLAFFKGQKVCLVCATPYQECLVRNSLRNRVVPNEVIRRMYMNWNTPFYYEGWDSIEIHYAEGAKNFFGEPRDFATRYMNYSQDNPHHKETLGMHVLEAMNFVVQATGGGESDNLSLAALLHDCGKPFTKTFTNGKGEKSDIAHYYQHACVGAYDAMFYKYTDKAESDVLEICTLINLHMNPFAWQSENTIEKQRKKLGARLMEDIHILHKADESASHHI